MRRALVCLLFVFACGDDDGATDAGRDAGPRDAGPRDSATRDAESPVDDGGSDAGDDDAGDDGGTPPASVCPAGSDALELELDGVSLTRVSGVPIEDGFASGFSIVEGPVFFDGALHVSHFAGGNTPASRVYRISTSGEVTIAFSMAGTNGLAIGADGRLFGASHVQGAIVRFDPTSPSSAPTPVVTGFGGARFNTPNDLVFRSDGQIYLSDPDWQAPSPRPQAQERAYRVDLEGNVTAIPGAPDKPNGVALSLDERTLFVTGTNGMRRFALAEDGAIAGEADEVLDGGFDGIGRDCAGNLYVTGRDTSGAEGVFVLNRELALIGTLPLRSATNAAFGGSDRRTLYVTTLGTPPSLYAARLNVPGLPD
jgi:gluconolactonase